MSSWQERVQFELNELKQRIESLYNFLGTDGFYKLSENHQEMLKTQLEIMRAYASILTLRLKDGKA